MPNFEQAKRAASTQIGNLTEVLTGYKIATLELTEAQLGVEGAIEQAQAETNFDNATNGFHAANREVDGILRGHGFEGKELQHAKETIMQEVDKDATRFFAQKVGPERMKILGLDADGKSPLPSGITGITKEEIEKEITREINILSNNLWQPRVSPSKLPDNIAHAADLAGQGIKNSVRKYNQEVGAALREQIEKMPDDKRVIHQFGEERQPLSDDTTNSRKSSSQDQKGGRIR